MTMITIDNKEYDTEDFSQGAQEHFKSLQFASNEIARLEMQVAAMQTARNAYVRALRDLLESEGSDDKLQEMPSSISFE